MAKSVLAVERACDLMFLIASSPAGFGVSELANELGLSKSAVHRLLVALSNKSMVQKDSPTQQYRLHAKVLELVLPFRSQNDMHAIARPFLDGLRDRFQETAVMAVREGFSCRLVACAPSAHELRYSPTIGRVMPLHWGAFGRAILADLPAEEFEAFFRDTPLTPATTHTTIEPEQLRSEARRIREQGFSTSTGEVIEGHVGIAASVKDHRDNPVACIGIGGPEMRLLQLDMVNIGRAVREAARHMSNYLRLQAL